MHDKTHKKSINHLLCVIADTGVGFCLRGKLLEYSHSCSFLGVTKMSDYRKTWICIAREKRENNGNPLTFTYPA